MWIFPYYWHTNCASMYWHTYYFTWLTIRCVFDPFHWLSGTALLCMAWSLSIGDVDEIFLLYDFFLTNTHTSLLLAKRFPVWYLRLFCPGHDVPLMLLIQRTSVRWTEVLSHHVHSSMLKYALYDSYYIHYIISFLSNYYLEAHGSHTWFLFVSLNLKSRRICLERMNFSM